MAHRPWEHLPEGPAAGFCLQLFQVGEEMNWRFCSRIVIAGCLTLFLFGCSTGQPKPSTTVTPTAPAVALPATATPTVLAAATSAATSTPTLTPVPVATATGTPQPTIASTTTATALPRPTWTSYPVFGGEMTAIAVDPSDPTTVYVGTKGAGVFKTGDGGRVWEPARAGLTFHPITALLIDPQHPNIVYVGTAQDGVWKSTDASKSWQKASKQFDNHMTVLNMAIDSLNTDTLYALIAPDPGEKSGSIHKSSDGGMTWHPKNDGIPMASEHTAGILSLVIGLDNPAVLYAGTAEHGVFRSSDEAESWVAINDGLPLAQDSSEAYAPVTAVGIDPHHDNRLAALTGDDYYVHDPATGWKRVSESRLVRGSRLYFHPDDPTVIFSTGGELIGQLSASWDGGISWAQILGPPESASVTGIAIPPLAPDTIFAASATATSPIGGHLGGVYKSDDRGESWTLASKGITALAIRSVAIDPRNRDLIYAGTALGHLLRSRDGGATWDHRHLKHAPVTDLAIGPSKPGTIWAVADNVYRSVNGGESFERVKGIRFMRSIALGPEDSNTIYAGSAAGFGISKSTDGGSTWATKKEGLPPFGSNTCPTLALVVDPRDPSTVWAGMQYGCGIVWSRDGGDSWEARGLPDSVAVNAIAIHPHNSDALLVATQYADGRIYTSADRGDMWVETLSGVAPVQDILLDPRNPQWIYAATEGDGILRSTDGGEMWGPFSEGTFTPTMNALAISREDHPLLIAGSDGGGLYWIRPLGATD